MNNKDEILQCATQVANRQQEIENLKQAKYALEMQLRDLIHQISEADKLHLAEARNLFELASHYPNKQSIVFNFGNRILAITKATNKTRYAEYYPTIPANE